MAELCSITTDNNVLPEPKASPQEPSAPSTSFNITTKTTELKQRNSPSPTETVCCLNELSVNEDIEDPVDPFEPVAGPSRSQPILLDDGYLHNNPAEEVRDDIDVLLDNSLNETQERILQDNRTPERRNFDDDDEDNILNLGVHKRIISSGSSSNHAPNNEMFVKSSLWNNLGEECFEENDDDEEEDDDGDDSWMEDDEDDDDPIYEEAMEENRCQDDVSEHEELVNGDVDDDDSESDDDCIDERLPAMEVGNPVNIDGAAGDHHCRRSWRKRKLESENSFPSKKLFPETNKTVNILDENNAEGDCLNHTLEKLKAVCAASSKTSTSSLTEKKPRLVIPTKDNPPPEMPGWLSQFQRWSNAERLLAIDELIDRCEPTQVRHMMQVIEPQFQRDFISLLPHELALNVLRFLEPKDLLTAAQTCRSWRDLAEDNLLWKEKCRQAGINELPSMDDFDRPLLKKRSKHLHQQLTCDIQHSSPWKSAYMRQHAIEINWRVKPIRPPKVLKGHDDHVITCLQFCGNRIVSGSDDNTLKVWSAVSGKCLRTLVGHTGGVWSSQMDGNVIISGSTDRTLKIWNADSGVCIHTLYGHTSTVRCMHLHENRVVSGSRDATLRMWDIVTGECLHVLVGHLAAVRCVQYDGRLVVSGAYDYMVKVWNPEREECLHTLQGHTNRVYSLQFDGVHVVSGSLDTSIRVWEVETGACRHTLMGHQSLTSGMELRNNILVSGNADSTVKVWDIVTGQCLQTLSGANKHLSAVTCLQFNNRFVITSSDDGTVKLWDVRTGAFIRDLVALDSGGSGGVVWRIRANDTKLVCAVGSRNGTEETKLLVLDFDVECCQPQHQLMTLTNLNNVITADTTDR